MAKIIETQGSGASVNEQTLLEGAWLSIQQAGHLLESAVLLLDGSQHSTAAVIAAFGIEELGRSEILQTCAAELANGSRVLSVKNVNARCDDHVRKQSEAPVSVFLYDLKPEHDRTYVDAAHKAKSKRQPTDIHRARLRRLYVEVDQTGSSWNIPSAADPAKSREVVVQLADAYRVVVDNLARPFITSDRELDARIKRLNDRKARMLSARNSLSSPVCLPDVRRPATP